MEDFGVALERIFKASIQVKQNTLEQNKDKLIDAVRLLTNALVNGHKIFLFGNGGSAADAQHIAAEFIGRFQKERQALPAIALTTDTSILTALGNDYSFDIVFARQLEGLGQAGDVAMGISTSGNSPNILVGMRKARALGLKTIAFTGGDGGQLASLADISLIVPSKITARIQESHLCMAHSLCELVEQSYSQND